MAAASVALALNFSGGSSTMRTFLLLTFLLGITFTAGSVLAEDPGKVFGKGVAAADTVVVSELMANPDAYVGKTVRVKGTASDEEGQTVRVKVKDGEIVFPAGLVGDLVIAEGVWTSNTLDLETTKKVCAHRAEENGEEFDPSSVTECMTLYQLSGTGAEVVAR